MAVSIVGIGTWLPERKRTNDEWPASFLQREGHVGERTFNDIPESEDPLAAAILARDLATEADDPFLGVTTRRVADDDMTAAEAESLAALKALANAGIDPSEVDLILSNAVVPERIIPPTGCAVAHRIGATRATALGVEVGCASSVAQLEVARAYLESGLADVVLLTQSHLLLRAFPMLHPAAPGLGDAASALVLRRGAGLTIRGAFSMTHGDHASTVTWIRGMDDDTDQPWWKGGGEFRLGSRCPDRAKALMRETVTFGASALVEAARRGGVDIERLSALASVQPRGFLPGGIAERLGLLRDIAVTTYGYTGHLGACGPVLNLERAGNLGRFARGALIGMYGQGAGFTRASAILEVTEEISLS